jgi:drug/metabolite transporter (DMT)-like permease
MNKDDGMYAWAAFAAVAVFWGTTFLAIRIGVQTFPPFIMAGFRHTIGGILICGYFLLRGYKIPPVKDLKVFFVNGVLMLTLGNGLVSWAELYISSGLAALICSLTPVWLILINSVGKSREVINFKTILGLALCLGAQFFIFRRNVAELSNPDYLLGIVAIVFANFAWALGSIYSKNHQGRVNALFAAGLQMIAGGTVLNILAAFRGEWVNLHPSAEANWALAYLVVFGSIIAYGSYTYVLKKLPAAIVSTYAYLNTIVAVILGWLWLDEELSMQMIVAVALTIGGCWLINRSMQKAQ